MTLFEFLDLALHLVLGVVDGLADFVSGSIGLVRRRFLVRLLYLLCGVFRLSPGLLHRALRLVDESLVGSFFIANGFSDVLLDLANSLVKFSRNPILIHGFLSFSQLQLRFGEIPGEALSPGTAFFPNSTGVKQPERWLFFRQ
jgi:hypothetical protein